MFMSQKAFSSWWPTVQGDNSAEYISFFFQGEASLQNSDILDMFQKERLQDSHLWD